MGRVAAKRGASVGDLASSLQVGYDDDFTTDQSDQLDFRVGNAGLWVRNANALEVAAGTSLTALVTGYTPADVEIIFKLVTGASIAGCVIDVHARDHGASDHVVWELAGSDRSLYVNKGGAFTALIGDLAAAFVVNATRWFRLSIHGNDFETEWFATDPRDYKQTATQRQNNAAISTDRPRFGAFARGQVGLRVTRGAAASPFRVSDLTIRGVDL